MNLYKIEYHTRENGNQEVKFVFSQNKSTAVSKAFPSNINDIEVIYIEYICSQQEILL